MKQKKRETKTETGTGGVLDVDTAKKYTINKQKKTKYIPAVTQRKAVEVSAQVAAAEGKKEEKRKEKMFADTQGKHGASPEALR